MVPPKSCIGCTQCVRKDANDTQHPKLKVGDPIVTTQLGGVDVIECKTGKYVALTVAQAQPACSEDLTPIPEDATHLQDITPVYIPTAEATPK